MVQVRMGKSKPSAPMRPSPCLPPDSPLRALDYLALDDAALIDQCEVDHYRSSGPGGQKRNKTSSAVRLRHRPTDLIVTASENRSQHVNKVFALRRLREAIALEVRTAVDLSSAAAGDAFAECVTADGDFKVRKSDRRYYQALSEILHVLAACGMSVSDAAGRLGLSTARLVKLIRSDPKLWRRVNQMRAVAGAKPLR